MTPEDQGDKASHERQRLSRCKLLALPVSDNMIHLMSEPPAKHWTPAEEWLSRLATLNVARDHGDGKGCAPHKPLLLLSLMQMIADGHLKEPVLERSAELVFRFQNFWPIVEPRRGNRGDMRMPFHALGPQRDRIWKSTLTEDGRPSTSRDTTATVAIDPVLWTLLLLKSFRDRAAAVLITTYFPTDEQVALYLACDLTVPNEPDIAALKQQAQAYRKSVETGRSTKFRGQIITGYFFTCALTGYCLTTATGSFIVEAAHVRPLHKGGTNDVQNGLALTPNGHWMFDEGLWTIDKECRIVVAGETHFKDTTGSSLRDMHGRKLHFDPRSLARPAEEPMAYHRENVFVEARRTGIPQDRFY